MVGQAGFEPTTPSPPVKCATRLRYCPNGPYLTCSLIERKRLVAGRGRVFQVFCQLWAEVR